MSTFQSNILNIYGEKGKVWLDELPLLVVAISLKQELRDLKEAINLSYNYVLSSLQGDHHIILKIGLDSETRLIQISSATLYSCFCRTNRDMIANARI